MGCHYGGPRRSASYHKAKKSHGKLGVLPAGEGALVQVHIFIFLEIELEGLLSVQ